MRFSYSTTREITRGLKRIWDLQMGVTPYSARIIEDIDRALEALLTVFRANGTAVEGIADKNGNRRKYVSEGKSVSWVGAQTKGECRKCKLTKNMFFHDDLLQFFLEKKRKITEFSPDATVF